VKLKSSAFQDGQSIPPAYTCDGRDLSPPLAWSGEPAGTQSFALIADDPDATRGMFVHWLLWNMPASTHHIAEGGSPLPMGTLEGTTDFGSIGYGGPCPPSGTHRYFFKLYALDTTVGLQSGATKAKLEAAMKGHMLADAKLMGIYRRP
jgi:Raf kinase inhibitor-like YbhB/YbcL family protein